MRYLLILSLFIRSIYSRKPICSIVKGVWDETTQTCTICNDEGVNCFDVDTYKLYMFSDNFCIGEDYTYCGTSECQASATITECEVTIPNFYADNLTLRMNATCPSNKVCMCRGLTLNGEECNACVAGLESRTKFDCSNIQEDICWEAGSCSTETSSPTESPLILDYSYRSNITLQNNQKTLIEAASNAGDILIGASVNPISADAMISYINNGHYDLAVPGNIKWNYFVKETNFRDFDFSITDALVTKLVEAGAIIQGGDLISGRTNGILIPEQVVTEVQNSDTPDETLIEILDVYIKTVMEHYKDQVTYWNVVREHISSRTYSNLYFQTLGDEYVRIAFDIAKKYVKDDTIRLMWKEDIKNFDLSDSYLSYFLGTLRKYKELNVPVDTIGIEGIFIDRLHDIERVKVVLNYIVDMGYDIELSDISIPIYHFYDYDDIFQAQSDYMQAYVKACLDTNHCKGIQFYGMDDQLNPFDVVNELDELSLSGIIDTEGYKKPAWFSVREAFVDYENTMTLSASQNDNTSAAAAVQHADVIFLSFLMIVLTATKVLF